MSQVSKRNAVSRRSRNESWCRFMSSCSNKCEPRRSIASERPAIRELWNRAFSLNATRKCLSYASAAIFAGILHCIRLAGGHRLVHRYTVDLRLLLARSYEGKARDIDARTSFSIHCNASCRPSFLHDLDVHQFASILRRVPRWELGCMGEVPAPPPRPRFGPSLSRPNAPSAECNLLKPGYVAASCLHSAIDRPRRRL